MKRALWLLFSAVAFGTLGHAAVQAEPGDHRQVDRDCIPQKPRFPAKYAKSKELRAASPGERAHRLRLGFKYANTYVEAEVQELDLTGDGICDSIVVVSDPIGSGGDRDVLATIYLADQGLWQRVGARSAARSDLPTDVNTMASPDDSNFAFSDYVALRRAGQATTYLIAWHGGRVTNGFEGYRVYEIDRSNLMLRLVDKWNGEGANVYGAFKRFKDSRGVALFDPEIEASELREVCGLSIQSTPGLAAECSRLKR